ncbi:hypothetical protein KEM48_004566 [Puccinia striiformis f. sp. tritici PST-130]|nr:hypothetical protein KEM48_004566 [Puccinia striiformis f. sp. tritici PST-130]
MNIGCSSFPQFLTPPNPTWRSAVAQTGPAPHACASLLIAPHLLVSRPLTAQSQFSRGYRINDHRLPFLWVSCGSGLLDRSIAVFTRLSDKRSPPSFPLGVLVAQQNFNRSKSQQNSTINQFASYLTDYSRFSRDPVVRPHLLLSSLTQCNNPPVYHSTIDRSQGLFHSFNLSSAAVRHLLTPLISVSTTRTNDLTPIMLRPTLTPPPDDISRFAYHLQFDRRLPSAGWNARALNSSLGDQTLTSLTAPDLNTTPSSNSAAIHPNSTTTSTTPARRAQLFETTTRACKADGRSTRG